MLRIVQHNGVDSYNDNEIDSSLVNKFARWLIHLYICEIFA